jgi:hypothetical protein
VPDGLKNFALIAGSHRNDASSEGAGGPEPGILLCSVRDVAPQEQTGAGVGARRPMHPNFELTRHFNFMANVGFAQITIFVISC